VEEEMRDDPEEDGVIKAMKSKKALEKRKQKR
jgi:hypothetical protein